MTSWLSAREVRVCVQPLKLPPPACRVGMVCKSLLGKAHTVMAEGGIAAALANVDDRDNWKVHFADTMRGGQYVNQLANGGAARQGSARSRPRTGSMGRGFDRTKDGRILQRNFGGHKYPRLAHVGDRTGLEMIRTLQDHGVHQGIDVHMEHSVSPFLRTANASPGPLVTNRERGRFRIFRAKAVCWPPAELAGPTKSPATAGNTPAMAIRSLIMPAQI